MTLKEVGDTGVTVASLGIVAFAILFLVCVRWWSDVLGRSIAAVAIVPAVILGLSIYRMAGGGLAGGVQLWRAILYPVLGGVIWVAVGLFIWYQFFAPRRNDKEKIDA